MGWIYLAESAESHSPWLPGCVQSPTVKTTNTLNLYSYHGWLAGIFQQHQSGTTLEPSVFNHLLVPSILSTQVFPARTSVLQVIERAWQESGQDYFSKSYDYVAKFDQASFSWKTSQLSLFEGLTEFSWSSLRWGMIVDGRLYQPQKLAPRTYENDGSYLPTPTASNYGKNVGRKSDGITPSGRDRWSLTVRARRGDLPNHPKGKLNPAWIEQAMGYPLQWTAIEDWATQWFLSKRVRRSKDFSLLKTKIEDTNQ